MTVSPGEASRLYARWIAPSSSMQHRGDVELFAAFDCVDPVIELEFDP